MRKSTQKSGLKEKSKTYIVRGEKMVKHFYYHDEFELVDKIRAFESELEEREKIRFKEVAELWEDEHFAQVEPGTALSYTPALKRSIEILGDKEIKEIAPLDIKRILDRMALERYSAQTVRVQRIVLNLIFKFAVLNEYVDINPVTVVSVPRNLPKSKREIPTDEEIETVMQSADKPFGMFAYFLLFTGCRRGEALGLQWKDINFERGTVYIHQSVGFNGMDQNKPMLSAHTKTDAGTRYVIILDCLKNRLKDMQGELPDDYFVFGDETPPTKSSFRRRWERYLKETGLSITPHQLRHAYATILYDAGVDERMAQDLMGHSSIQVTKNIYTHIRKDHKAEAADSLNNYISAKMDMIEKKPV